MAFAQFTPSNANDDMWNNDVIMYFSTTAVRCGGEGRNFYHIGIGVWTGWNWRQHVYLSACVIQSINRCIFT